MSGRGVSRRAFVRGAAALAAVPWLDTEGLVTGAPVVTRRAWRGSVQDVPLLELEVWQAAELIRSRELTAVRLVEAFLERNAQVEPRIGTWASVWPVDEVMAQAERADAEIADGRYRGPLHGIPVGVKDIYLTRGKVTEGNSKLYRGFVPDEDATSVARLKEAGAVILGKAGTSELATANGWPAKNPWDFARAPGGSSTGSATGVAAGQFMVGMGTCTGGSIRGPAANCGITGFKPTYGTISLHGILPLAWSMDHAGPLVRSARDAALVVDALGGYDARDPLVRRVARYRMAESLDATPGAPNTGVLAGTVVAVPAEGDYFLGVVHPEEIEAFRAAIEVFRSLGATLRTVRTQALPEGISSTSSFYDIIRSAEVSAYQRANLLARPEAMSAGYLSRVASGVLMPGHAYLQAQRVRRIWRDRLLTVFDECDVFIHPADDVAALIEGGGSGAGRSSGSKTNPWNLSGAPAVAIPTGVSRAERMPLSMQVVARPGEDEKALRVADAFQQVTDHHRKRPAL